MDSVITSLLSEALVVVRSNGAELPDGWGTGRSGAIGKTARSGRIFVSARVGFVRRDGHRAPVPHVLLRRKFDDEDELDFVWCEIGDDGRVSMWDDASSPKLMELARAAFSG